MYVLLKGSVGVYVRDDEDDEDSALQLAILKEGSLFGEIAVLTRSNRTATVISRSKSELPTLIEMYFRRFVEKSRRIIQVLVNLKAVAKFQQTFLMTYICFAPLSQN